MNILIVFLAEKLNFNQFKYLIIYILVLIIYQTEKIKISYYKCIQMRFYENN